MPSRVTPCYEDPFFFDRDALQTIADDGVVAAGLADFKAHRVTQIDQNADTLWGEVEDEATQLSRGVEIRCEGDGALSLTCGCEAAADKICRHQVATLYAYADQQEEAGQILSAADSAIKARIKRGRSEVQVTHTAGKPWFGTWQARSTPADTRFSREYQVTIRNLEQRANICSCPDFINNQLGTCKHIEAVLHKLSKRRDYARLKKRPPETSYIYLAWDVADAPQICLRRAPALAEGQAAGLAALLHPFFNAAGIFTGRLPDDFFRLVELAGRRDDLLVGQDALDFANQLAADAAHQVSSLQIREQITAGGGRLSGLKARLYPYQVAGAAFLAGTGRALLADDMGLGKTLQAIAAAAWLRSHQGVRKILIICPASLKHQWAREIDRFTDLESQIVQGPPPKRDAQYRREAAFFILNYELVLRDLALINENLRPDLVIMDEAQRIKNWRTKIAAAVKNIPCRYAFVLTGTPLENRLEDLYSLMQVVNPKVLGPLWRYMVDFHVLDEYGKVLGYRNLSLLRRRLRPVMLRRDRSLVRDQLPHRIVQRLDVAMTVKQTELHDSAMSAAGALAALAKRRPLTPGEQNRLLAALQQARMACNAAGLVDKKTKGAPKLDELADLLEELCLQSGLKAVVFSQWEQMTRMVESRIKPMGLGYVRLHGGVPTARRGALLDRFRDDDAVQVFISTDAGGVGLNLQSGAVLINLDVPWNPAVLEQRSARIHRLGQTRKVQIITMVAANGYEGQVLELLQTKQSLFDNVVREDASEDVVAVSKKMLETLIEDLLPDPSPDRGSQAEEAEAAAAASPRKITSRIPGDPAVAAAIARCIEALQEAFGPRIDRICGAGGGLLVVLDRIDAAADQVAERLSADVPVALIDPLAFKGLERLGPHSPLAQAPVYYNAAESPDAGGGGRLGSLAAEKLKAAQLLLAQGLADSALELTLTSLLAAAADRAGESAPQSPQEAGVWIYSQAVPAGVLDPQDASLIMRGIGLAQSHAVPPALIQELVREAAGFVGS